MCETPVLARYSVAAHIERIERDVLVRNFMHKGFCLTHNPSYLLQLRKSRQENATLY